MNFIKSILYCSLLAITHLCQSQEARLYTVFDGTTPTILGTNNATQVGVTNQIIIGGITNQYGSTASFTITPSNQVQKVYEFDNVGFTLQFTGVTSSTNGNVNVKIYKSYDLGNVFEQTASSSYAFALAGAKTYSTNLNIVCTGATTLGISFDNEGSDYITNVLMEFKPKATKVMTRTSPQ